LNSKLQHN